jgi:glyoxylase-like metal-dependent hydrolase (beta-lactamase superfamily II)
LTFPKARHFMPKDEWEHWTSESTLAAMDENSAINVRKSLFPLQDRINLIDGEGEIIPGVYAVPAPGHTPSQIAVLVTSEGQGLLDMADAAHNPIQAERPHWSHPFDKQPDVSAASRHRLVEKAASENLLLMAYHFPFPGVGRISKGADSWRWQPMG